MTNFDCYGWNTTKQEDGSFTWMVDGFKSGEGRTILQSGVRKTRAQAAGMAKKWVLYYRHQAKKAA